MRYGTCTHTHTHTHMYTHTHTHTYTHTHMYTERDHRSLKLSCASVFLYTKNVERERDTYAHALKCLYVHTHVYTKQQPHKQHVHTVSFIKVYNKMCLFHCYADTSLLQVGRPGLTDSVL